MVRIGKWGRIVRQPKEKHWITAEYFVPSGSGHKRILVYYDEKYRALNLSPWIVWIGTSSTRGNYQTFKTKAQAMKFATSYMRRHPNG